MALVLKDRVRETSTTTGTGTFTLAGAVAGFQSFSAIGTGNTTYYTIATSSDWEVGIGTWTSPNQLSRGTILASTNGGSAVDFGSGTKDVFATFPAEGFAVAPPIGGTTPNTITGTTVTANANVYLPAVVNTGVTTGVIRMVDGGDGYDYISIWTDDGTSYYPVKFPGGADITGNLVISSQYTGQNAVFIGDGSQSGRIGLRGYTSTLDVTVQAAASTIPYTLTLPTSAGSNNQVLKTDGSGNLSWTDKFVLGAGTATAGTAPLKFTSGTNLTTAETGAMEYDGKVAYFTPSNTSRALLSSAYYYRKNTATTLTSATGNQAIFGLTSGVTVAANTIYEIECEFQLSTTGTTSHTEAFGFTLTTATVTNMGMAVNRLAGNTTSSALGTYLTSVTPVVVTGALTTAQVGIYRVKGTIAFGTGGSINPVIAFSAAPGGTSTIVLGGFMKMTPIATTGSNVSIGTWA
jgi:hypothetical protein